MPSDLIIMRVRSGAPTTERMVTTPRSEAASVNNRRTNSSPRSGSSFSARTRTGTTSEVSTVNVNVFAKTLPIARPSPSDDIAVRIASATVGTATNWKQRV